jgi:translation initiation factor IF-3
MGIFLRGLSPISDSDSTDELERRRQQRAAKRAEEKKEGETPETQIEPERGGSGRPPRRRKTAIGHSGDDNSTSGVFGIGIQAREVRLIDGDGSELGIFSTPEALKLAKERELDLFLVRPDENPPIARLVDYRRFKFEQEKKYREAKRKHGIVDVREIKMRYQIQDHDFAIKLRQAVKFLKDGDKVKLLILLRGRQLQHKDLAIALMQKFASELDGLASVDSELKMEGKSLIMGFSPLKVR